MYIRHVSKLIITFKLRSTLFPMRHRDLFHSGSFIREKTMSTRIGPRSTLILQCFSIHMDPFAAFAIVGLTG